MPKHFNEDEDADNISERKQKKLVEEKTDEAKQNVKIKSLQDKGMSERDAVIKGLISMKHTKKESEAVPTIAPSSPDKEEYPYGLRIRLENDDLEKLGIDSLPDIDTKMKITASAVVQSISSNQSVGSEGEKKCLELQITDMSVGDKVPSQETEE